MGAGAARPTVMLQSVVGEGEGWRRGGEKGSCARQRRVCGEEEGQLLSPRVHGRGAGGGRQWAGVKDGEWEEEGVAAPVRPHLARCPALHPKACGAEALQRTPLLDVRAAVVERGEGRRRRGPAELTGRRGRSIGGEVGARRVCGVRARPGVSARRWTKTAPVQTGERQNDTTAYSRKH